MEQGDELDGEQAWRDQNSPDDESLEPDRLRFEIGGHPGPSFLVEWMPEARSLSVTQEGGYGSEDDAVRLYTVTESQWRVFRAVLDHLNVGRWKPRYDVPSCDGTSWEVDMAFGRLRVKSGGHNGYPGADPDENPDAPFNVFLAAVNMLCHRSDIR